MTRSEWQNKIKERDSTIKQMRKNGMTGTAIARALNIPQSTVYGALGHESRGKENDLTEMRNFEHLIEENHALDALKARIRVGDKVRFTRDGMTIDAEVIMPHPYVVHCRDKSGLNYSPVYMDILRIK